METNSSTISRLYDEIKNARLDPISTEMPLLLSPTMYLALSFAWLLFVLKWGPQWMKQRPAYTLHKTLLAYNLALAILNGYGLYYAYCRLVKQNSFDLICFDALHNSSPYRNIEVRFYILFYVLKLVDYMDTVFFVLRKSERQISFLHLYHHLSTSATAFYFIRHYGTGGHCSLMMIINSTVHVVMYLYYFLTILKPSLKHSAWKRHITHLQLIQFAAVLIHNILPLIARSKCNYPRYLHYVGIIQMLVFTMLFGNFYRTTYRKRSTASLSSEKTLERSTQNGCELKKLN